MPTHLLTMFRERLSRSSAALLDSVFLSLVVLLSVSLYAGELGFYIDDWNFLATFKYSEDQSVFGLFETAYTAQPWARMRPVQLFYFAALYKLFGLYPLGYHLINAFVLIMLAVLFYSVLRELGQSRLLGLAIPLTYILLPHYYTDRFWIAASQASLSMALYFLSLYSDLRASRATTAKFWRWKLLSLACLSGSILAYEVTLPLFLLNLFAIRYREQQLLKAQPGERKMSRKLAVSLACNGVALALVIGFKVAVATRIGVGVDFPLHAFNVARAAISATVSGNGVRLTLLSLSDQPDLTTLLMGGALGFLIFGYLYFIARRPETILPDKRDCVRLIVAGLIAYGFSYSIFLATNTVALPVAEMGNRYVIAAAAGLAVALIGALSLTTAWAPFASFRKIYFCLMVTLVCVAGFVVINTVAKYWVTAYRQEQEVLTAIKSRFPSLPAGSVLLLDGTCLKRGPVYVFRYAWDFEGALRTVYNDPSLRGDLVTSRLSVGEEGISTSLDGEDRLYPPGEKLIVFHFGHKTAFPLTDAESARQYLQAADANPYGDCLENKR